MSLFSARCLVMPSMFRLLSPSLLLAEYHGQPASAYRFWQGVFLPSFVAVDMAEPSRDLSSKDLQKVSLPTSHFPPLRPAGSARPSAGRSAKKLPSPGHPCSDVPCRHGTQGRPAAHDWLGVWSSQSAPCAPHHNLLRTDGPYQDHHPCCPAPLLDGTRNIACCQRFPQPNLADH